VYSVERVPALELQGDSTFNLMIAGGCAGTTDVHVRRNGSTLGSFTLAASKTRVVRSEERGIAATRSSPERMRAMWYRLFFVVFSIVVILSISTARRANAQIESYQVDG